MTVVNGIPTVAYHDLGSTSYVQTWSGQGDVNDPATWSAPQTFPGLQPEIASAAGRLVAVDQKPDGSGDLELRDLASGLARTISTGGAGARAVPIGHSDGTVSVVWQGAEGVVRGLWQRDRIGPTGPIRGTPTLLSTEEGAFLSADSADDGGGVAVRDTLDRKILLTAFGNTLPTGVRGLGGAPGGGAPPADVAVDCQKIQLGRATQVLLPPGPCFLNAAKGGREGQPGAAEAERDGDRPRRRRAAADRPQRQDHPQHGHRHRAPARARASPTSRSSGGGSTSPRRARAPEPSSGSSARSSSSRTCWASR